MSDHTPARSAAHTRQAAHRARSECSFAFVLDSGEEITAQPTLGSLDFRRKTYNPITIGDRVELVSSIGSSPEDGGGMPPAP